LSGNGNHFTAVGFETANQASPAYDIVKDSPTNNFATINPLYPGASTSNANLTTPNTTGKPTIIGLAGDVHVGGNSQAWDGTEAGWTFTGDVDFGQRLTPDEISTANMFTPAIADGRDHFQAITGDGSSILQAAKAVFPKGLWWIKDRANTTDHQLMDHIRGNLAFTSPQGNYRTYIDPAGASVAWCWSADQAAAFPIGSEGATLETACVLNKKAGFAIVELLNPLGGRGTGAHGLDKAPEFIISQSNNVAISANLIDCYHVETGEDFYLSLTSNAAATPSAGHWNVDDNVVGTGNTGAGLTDPANHTLYCWHSVPGYSAFTSYQGNSSEDGPFVYLGFRPAILIIKAKSSANGWVMHDSSRKVFNPVDQYLRADAVNIEASGQDVDFLSNGFKVRISSGGINAGGADYLVMAWAENPFQAPVTAR
jgi:hypothetical protein